MHRANAIKLFFLLLVTSSVSGDEILAQSGYRLVDKRATTETKALFNNLKQLSKTNILFGHQHATEYGHGWSGDENRSDVKSVTGSHPAVIGVDFNGLSGLPRNVIDNTKAALRRNIADTYNRGGITTVSWHFSNPVSAGDFYWKDSISAPAVRYIIPGGSHHEKYKDILKDVADLVKSVKGNDGKLVPMIFRPYHEFDGDWFWWGRSHCSISEFVSLWRFTVSYLRDSMQINNLLYAFSPDNRFNTEEEFLERYPGDEWVDMIGMDNYGDFGRDGKYNIEAGLKKLKIISDLALKKGKLAAFTETGLESIPNPVWWTSVLLKTLKQDLQLCYVLVWRNDTRSPTHYYAPFPGHGSEKDFLKFYNDPFTLFENDLKDIYSTSLPVGN